MMILPHRVMGIIVFDVGEINNESESPDLYTVAAGHLACPACTLSNCIAERCYGWFFFRTDNICICGDKKRFNI